MVALNFKREFADLVRSGRKRQTIRAMRQRRFAKGDTLQLYTGMRTKRCEKLVEPDPVCIEVQTINIFSPCGPIHLKSGAGDWSELSKEECSLLAKADGFQHDIDLLFFFADNHTFPFIGQLIKW